MIRVVQRQQLQAFNLVEGKSLLTVITPLCELTLIRCTIESRAAFTIQRYWQMFRFRQRVTLISNLTKHLSEIGPETRTLFLHEDLYLQMEQISDSLSSLNKLPESRCMNFQFEDCDRGAQRVASIEFSKCTLLDTPKFQHFAGRLRTYPLPIWALRRLQCAVSLLGRNSGDVRCVEQDGLLSLVHFASGSNQPIVLDFNQIVQNKPFPIANGLNFVAVNCLSQQDAIKRSLAFSLLMMNTKR